MSQSMTQVNERGDGRTGIVVRLLSMIACALGVSSGWAAAPPEALAERVKFIEEQVEEMRREGVLPAQKVERLERLQHLKDSLLARFPVGSPETPQGREDLALLLKAAILCEALDTRSYNERPPTGDGWQPPEDVAASTKVYNIDLFNALLEKPRLEPARDHHGRTALMYAAESNRFEVLRTLLLMPGDEPFEPLYKGDDDKGRPYIDWCDKDGYTALMYAAASNSGDATHYLINAGADLEIRCEVAQFTALQLAQSAGHDAIMNAIERRLSQKPWYVRLFEHNLFFPVLTIVFVVVVVSLRGWFEYRLALAGHLPDQPKRGKRVSEAGGGES